MTNKKVLYLINNAPLYREKFLRELGHVTDLKVVAGRSPTNLKEPIERKGYKYEEFPTEGKIPIYFNIRKIISSIKYNPEVVIIGWNLHDLSRYILYLIFKLMKKKIIFTGIYYGNSNGSLKKTIMKYILNNSDGVLAYSNVIYKKLKSDGIRTKILSFNNNDIDEFYEKKFIKESKGLNISYIGRQQERKKIERLIEYVNDNKDIHLHLIGPGMSMYEDLNIENLTIHEEMYETQLTEYLLSTIDLICVPGPSGLITLTAAQHGIPLLVDKYSNHGPEVSIAYESDQEFTDWTNFEEISQKLKAFEDYNYRKTKGKNLQDLAMKRYNIKFMTSIYMEMIEDD